MPSNYDAFELAPPARIDNGIPVTANTIAGMREGETGWLNAACDAAGLAASMHQVIERHTAEIGAIYREAIDGICRAA